MAIAPLAFAIPLLAAALFIGLGSHLPRVVADLGALAVAVAVAALCAVLLGDVWDGRLVTWLGGWHPRSGVAIGIDLAVDPIGAGAATLVGVLMVAALLSSQRYFEAVTPAYHALMLLFLAGMVGFCLTGDLFNLFVMFELMGVAAYGLTGYKSEEAGPIQGALNFAITNSFGAFLLLSGIGLIYGRTGALNLAQIGVALGGRHPDGLVLVAFGLIVAGFLVKAAAAPFHFWLDDAHAVAPTPVCVLFSGVMVQLGLYGVARVYWTAFSGTLHPSDRGLVVVLVLLGAFTALLGAVMCLEQHNLKRLLAFSTISHTGLFLVGVGVLDAHGLGAAALFVLAHGLVKGSLFLATGILAHRAGGVDEIDLHGRGRGLWVTGAVFALGGLALASLPPFGPFLGKALVEESGQVAGLWWVPIVFLVASALTGGAILRATGRVFLGLGPEREARAGEEGGAEAEAESEEPETEGRHEHTPFVMAVPAVALLAAGLALGVLPQVKEGFEHAAALLVDRVSYGATVLHDATPPPPVDHPSSGPHVSAYLYAAGSVVGALLVAAAALGREHVRGLARVGRVGRPPLRALRAAHSGHVGDYVAWVTVGATALTGLIALVVQ